MKRILSFLFLFFILKNFCCPVNFSLKPRDREQELLDSSSVISAQYRREFGAGGGGGEGQKFDRVTGRPAIGSRRCAARRAAPF